MTGTNKEITHLITQMGKLHADYLSNLEKNNTEINRNIAEFKVLTKELSAKREIINQYFEKRMSERKQMYDIANEVLDKAIKTGNCEMADLAINHIKLIKNG